MDHSIISHLGTYPGITLCGFILISFVLGILVGIIYEHKYYNEKDFYEDFKKDTKKRDRFYNPFS